MSSLKELFSAPEKRAQVVRDATQLVADEVANKRGLTGAAIKTAFKAVSALKPGLIQETVDHLLDQFVVQLEPFFTSWDQGGRSGSFDQYLIGRKNQVANALLKVTDDRAKVVANATLRKTYERLRPMGEKNVEEAVPGLGRVMNRHIN